MKRGTLLTVLFAAVLPVLALIFLLAPARGFSEPENRLLAQKPAFSAGALLSGEWQRGLETWLGDQFPARDSLMAVSTQLRKDAGQKDVGGAWLADGGAYPEVHTADAFDTDGFEKNLGVIAQFAARDTFADAAVCVLLVPDAACTMQDSLPALARPYDAKALASQAAALLPDCSVPDLASAFSDAAGETPLYYRTDHHWNAHGVQLAYQLLSDGRGRYSRPPQVFSEDFLGSTYSRTLDPAAVPEPLSIFPVPDGLSVTADGENISLYDESAAQKKDKYTVFFGGNHGIVTIGNTGAGTGKSLLIVKDSFANALVPLLTADYDVITMLDLRYFGGSPAALAADLQPDDLLFVYSMSDLAEGSELVKLLLN